jgi:hypothetical protein
MESDFNNNITKIRNAVIALDGISDKKCRDVKA